MYSLTSLLIWLDLTLSITKKSIWSLYDNVTSFMSDIDKNSGHLHCELARILLCLQTHRKTFFVSSGVQFAQTNHDMFRFGRMVFYSQLKSKVGNILSKAATLCINLNKDDSHIPSRSKTHPSHSTHSETSRLFSSSLSLRIPYPRSTQCVRGF